MSPTNKAWSLIVFGQTGRARIHICGEDMLPSIKITLDLSRVTSTGIILKSRQAHFSFCEESGDFHWEHRDRPNWPKSWNGARPKPEEADFKRYFRPDLMNKPSLVETSEKKKAKTSVLSLESYHSPEAMTPEPKPTEPLVFTECQEAELRALSTEPERKRRAPNPQPGRAESERSAELRGE
ncbi:hypothetical protein T492DRAFT_857468 [Pavlovales sp. CCMP2436]|nr:hypothetical protein T492DRAFT_857468 [Pavlovales sp. CCMP2436]